MIPECAWYCRDTYAMNLRINLQLINNEMIILYASFACTYLSTYYSHPLKPVYLSFFFCLTVHVLMFVYIMYISIVIITIFIRKIKSI